MRECILCKSDENLTKILAKDERSFYKYGATVTRGELVDVCPACGTKIYNETNNNTILRRLVDFNDKSLERILHVSVVALALYDSFQAQSYNTEATLEDIKDDLTREYLKDMLEAAPDMTNALMDYYLTDMKGFKCMEARFNSAEEFQKYVAENMAYMINYYVKYYTTAEIKRSTRMQSF